MNCRFCNTSLVDLFLDLQNAPLSNSFISADKLFEPEVYYPLALFTCPNCFLVQVAEYKSHSEIFNEEYIYYSSYSKSWVQHAHDYCLDIVQKRQLDSNSFVVEIASNDGYLLQFFNERNIPCLGVEPSGGPAQVAKEKGIETVEEFFGEELAKSLRSQRSAADLIIGNNVFAHVPAVNDFVAGVKALLGQDGAVTLEFPHLMQLVHGNQFDTVYHEHFSYFSLHTACQIFEAHELVVFDVEELPTHGGSLRIYGCHNSPDVRPTTAVKSVLSKERKAGMTDMAFYQSFQSCADTIKYELTEFLLKQKKLGKTVIAYGAAAKGNTLLNYCGIKKDMIDFVVDKSPHKQGKCLPGSHIPVKDEFEIRVAQPDYVLILPWNIKEEIKEQLSYIKEWGAEFVTAIPDLEMG